MSEFQAAAMMAQMGRLDEQAKTRDENAAYLSKMLGEQPGVAPAKMYPGCTRNGYTLLHDALRQGRDGRVAPQALRRSRPRRRHSDGAGYTPLNKHPFLENTLNSRAFRAIYSQQDINRWRKRNHCPADDQLCEQGLWFSHNILLDSRAGMEDIVAAIRKVQRHAAALKKT